jgi:phosphohistidine phosphatase
MELYLVRHGIAQEWHPDIKDEERELTAQGREKTQKVAKRLYDLGLQFELILTSPLVRSRQTAEILRSCGLSSQVEELSCLAPEGDIQNWLSWLEQRQMPLAHAPLALVGHQPDLGQWAEILVWGKARVEAFADTAASSDPRVSSPPVIVLKKAGIIGLKLPENGSVMGRSQMFWLTSPKFLL